MASKFSSLVRFSSVFFLACIGSIVAPAPMAKELTYENIATVSRSYWIEDQNTPSSIVFGHLAGMYTSVVRKVGRNEAIGEIYVDLNLVPHEGGPEGALILADPLLHSKGDARKVLNALLDGAKNIDTAVFSAIQRVACTNGSAKVYGSDIYQALEDIDDLKEAAYEVEFNSMLKSLSEQLHPSINRWFKRMRIGLTYIKYDYEAFHNWIGISQAEAENDLNKLCYDQTI